MLDLFKVPGIFRHFIISTIVHVFLPILIYSFYPPQSNQYLLHRHRWFLNFDAVHYFHNQYHYEPNHAFLPLYVQLVQFAKYLVGQSSAIGLLLIINKLAFVVAATDLYKILINLCNKNSKQQPEYDQKDEIWRRTVPKIGILFFFYNPAGIFFNSIYTESLFCMITFRAIRLLLERKAQYPQLQFLRHIPLLRNLLAESEAIVPTLLLTLSVGIRSNGLFLAPVIGLQILQKAVNIKSHFQQRRIKEYIGNLLKGAFILFSLIVPFLLHNLFCYYNICVNSAVKGEICSKGMFGLYGAVQQRYWGVGFLKYFLGRNVLFIIIGTPAIIIAFCGLFYYSKMFCIRQKGLYLSYMILFLVTLCYTNIQSSTRFFCGHPFFYYILARLYLTNRIFGVWAIFYWLLGIFMYVIGFPWT